MKSKRDFARVYDKKLRAGDGYLLVFAAENSLGRTRFGLSVSRKVGKAIVRTSVKRLLREAFRLSQHKLPSGLDLILIPQRQAAGAAGLTDYQNSLVELTRRVARRFASRQA
jgi:ribonuclease P protein component